MDRKALSINLNFSFLKRISPHIPRRYPIVLTRLGGAHFKTLYFQKNVMESKLSPLRSQSDVLTTIPKKFGVRVHIVIFLNITTADRLK